MNPFGLEQRHGFNFGEFFWIKAIQLIQSNQLLFQHFSESEENVIEIKNGTTLMQMPLCTEVVMKGP